MQLRSNTNSCSDSDRIDKSGSFETTSETRPVIEVFEIIKDQLAQVRRKIDEQLTEDCDKTGTDDLLGTLRNHGGKMLRPGLVLLAGGSCGDIIDRHIHVAAMVEMIHAATLLHDDVIDEGKQRRGEPTVNHVWGNESAVLLGDVLLSKVFGMCVDLEPPIIKIIANAAARTCQGELRQVSQRQNWQLSESEYLEIITEKSATLLSCCCHIGALLAGADEKDTRSMAEFGLNLGIAFQITDDLLDIVGDEARTGKTLGTDFDKNKLTLALIHLLDTADEKQKTAAMDLLSAETVRKEEVAKLLGSALADIRESDSKAALIKTAKFVIERTK
jgi:octaprenyl-diphosphate synthase